MPFYGFGAVVFYAYADTRNAELTGLLDRTSIESDLEELDLSGISAADGLQLVYFAELGYREANSTDYGIYFYIYNPEKISFNTEQFIKYLSVPNFFYIDCAPGAYDLETLLKTMYDTDNITLFVPEGLAHPYKLIVSSAEGEEIVIQLTQSQQ